MLPYTSLNMATAPILEFSIFGPPEERPKANAGERMRLPVGAPIDDEGGNSAVVTGSKRRRPDSMELDTAMDLDDETVVPSVINGMDVIATPAVKREDFDGGNRLYSTQAAEITQGTTTGLSVATPPPVHLWGRTDPPLEEPLYTRLIRERTKFRIREPMRGSSSDATLLAGSAYTTFFSSGLVFAGKVMRRTANGAVFYEADFERPIHEGRPIENFLRALAEGITVFYYYPDVVVQRVDDNGKAVGKGILVHATDADQLMTNLELNGLKRPPFMYRVSSIANPETGEFKTFERMEIVATNEQLEQLFSDTVSNFGLHNPVLFVHNDQEWRDQMVVPRKALRFFSEADLANAETALIGGLIDDRDPRRSTKSRAALKKVRVLQDEVANSPAAAATRGMTTDKAIEQVILNLRLAAQLSKDQGSAEAKALATGAADLEALREALREGAADEEQRAQIESMKKERATLKNTERDIELLRYRRVKADKQMSKTGTGAPTIRGVRKAVLEELKQSVRADARSTFVMPEEVTRAVYALTLDWSRVKAGVQERYNELIKRSGPSPTQSTAADIRILEGVLAAVVENSGTPDADNITLAKIHVLVHARPDLFSLVTPFVSSNGVKTVVRTLLDSAQAASSISKRASAKAAITGVKDAAAVALALSEPLNEEELAVAEARDEAEDTKAAQASRNRTRAVRSVMSNRTNSSDGRPSRLTGIPATFLFFGSFEPLSSDDPNATDDDAVPNVRSFPFPMAKGVSWENITTERGSSMFLEGSIFYPAVLEEPVGSADPDHPSTWQMSAPAVLRALRPVDRPLFAVSEVQAELAPTASGEPSTVAFFVSSPFFFKVMEKSIDGRRASGSRQAHYAFEYSDMLKELGLGGSEMRWQLFWYNPRSRNDDGIVAYGNTIEWQGHYPLVSQADFITWRSMVENSSLTVVRIPPTLQTRDEKGMMRLAREKVESLAAKTTGSDSKEGTASETSSPAVPTPPVEPVRRRRVIDDSDDDDTPPSIFE